MFSFGFRTIEDGVTNRLQEISRKGIVKLLEDKHVGENFIN